MKKSAIVVTTVFEPEFLGGYVANLEAHGRSRDVDIIVIVDRRTPRSMEEACRKHRAQGFSVLCPSLDEQEQFVSRLPDMAGRIPYDSDNRRNVGFLMALERGADVLISIDDDNHCLPETDFVGEHAIAGETRTVTEVTSSDGWFNAATMLREDGAREIYPRGFPYAARHGPREVTRSEPVTRRIAINAGLSIGDPDVDAVTRLATRPRVSAADGQALVLGPGAWSPVNTQNTAVARDAVAAYYYVRMGHSLGGKEVLYAMAFDERYRAGVSSEGGVGLTFSNWGAPWYLGAKIKQPGFKLENHEVLALVAPRGFLLLAGDSADGDRSWAFIQAVKPVYDLLGAGGDIGWLNHHQGHRYSPEARAAAEAFLDQHLKR